MALLHKPYTLSVCTCPKSSSDDLKSSQDETRNKMYYFARLLLFRLANGAVVDTQNSDVNSTREVGMFNFLPPPHRPVSHTLPPYPSVVSEPQP